MSQICAHSRDRHNSSLLRFTKVGHEPLSWWNLPHSPGEPQMGQNALSCLGQLANPDTGVIFARIKFACTALCERKSPHGELSLRWACYTGDSTRGSTRWSSMSGMNSSMLIHPVKGVSSSEGTTISRSHASGTTAGNTAHSVRQSPRCPGTGITSRWGASRF